MRRPIVGLAAGLVAAAAAGAVAAVSLTGTQAVPGAARPPRPSTAEVERQDLTASVLTGGTLGYRSMAPVINAVAGTYTWLPRPGRVIAPGGDLYRVDDSPVILMAGPVPAWRALQPGMTGGPDVRQLQAGLIAGHFGRGLLTAATGQFGPATEVAAERWQAAHGLPVTGTIPLGQVVFLPGRVRVGAWQIMPGGQAVAGQQPYLVTSSRRVVTVPLSADLPDVRVGQRVSIVLPSQVSTPGEVTAIGPAQPAAVASQASTSQASASHASTSQGNAAQGGTGQGQLTVTPLRPAATGTASGLPVQVSLAVQVATHALAVPVSALLAVAGGGYGLEVVLPSGAHRLVGVSTGLFASGEVAVSGPGLRAGLRVVTAQ